MALVRATVARPKQSSLSSKRGPPSSTTEEVFFFLDRICAASSALLSMGFSMGSHWQSAKA